MKKLGDIYWKLVKKWYKFKDWKARKLLLAESLQAHIWNKWAKTDYSVAEWKAILRKRHDNKRRRK